MSDKIVLRLLPLYVWVLMLITFIIALIVAEFQILISLKCGVYCRILAFIGVVSGIIVLISMTYYLIYCPIKKRGK